jgi:hypothetical protein
MLVGITIVSINPNPDPNPNSIRVTISDLGLSPLGGMENIYETSLNLYVLPVQDSPKVILTLTLTSP